MYLKIRKFFVLTFVFVLLVSLFPAHVIAAEDEISPIISELQTGGCASFSEVNPGTCEVEDPSEEFVELYNPLAIKLNVAGWKIQYLTASGKTERDLVVLNGSIHPQSHILIARDGYFTEIADIFFSSSLAKSGGHIRIIDNSGQVIDLVGWGTAEAAGDWPKISEIVPGYSIKKILPIDPLYGTGIIYTPSSLPITPQGGGYLPESSTDNPNDDQNSDGGMGGGSGDGTQNSCDGVLITEILPNPAGSDIGNEFIELYNPTSKNISLEGCQLTASSKFYAFGDAELSAKQYKAFYNDITGLTLTNSSGDNVYLLDTDGSEIQDVTYQPDLDDDVVWALHISQNTWTISYVQTPGKPNEIVKIKPCSKGQFRNMETNRCNNIAIEAGLGPCPAGKFRNPETNRCKNILDASSQLKPCSPSQFRNPETNRCKSLSASRRSLVPCKSDQERNPETNRCRKVTGLSSANSSNGVKDVLSVSQAQGKTSWAMAGFSFAGASAYAVWEWRREMLEKLLALKSMLGIK